MGVVQAEVEEEELSERIPRAHDVFMPDTCHPLEKGNDVTDYDHTS